MTRPGVSSSRTSTRPELGRESLVESGVAGRTGRARQRERADLVAVHFHFRREAGTRGHAIIDILRVEDGYIVEHWDVMQDVSDPATSKNQNGMF